MNMNSPTDARNASSWPQPATAWGLDLLSGGGIAVLADRSGRVIERVERPAPPRADQSAPRRPVSTCLGSEESLLLWISAPIASVQKAVRVFPSLLDIQLPFPIESCEARFLAIRRTPERTTKALAVAARIETIKRRIETCRAAGWDPLIIDHEGLALWTRALAERPLAAGRMRVLAGLYPDRAVLVRGESEIIGVQVIRRQPGEPDAADARALADRIRRALMPEIEEKTEVQWLWCGPRAADSAFTGALHAELAARWPGECATLPDPAAFLARALAVRLARHDPLAVNFRSGVLAHPELSRHAARRRRGAIILLMAAAGALLALNILWRFAAKARVEQESRAVAELAAGLAPGARIPQGMEVREARRAVERTSAETAAFRGAIEHSIMPGLAAVAGAAREHGVSLGSLALKDSRIEITGAGPDWPACERFAGAVRELGFKARIERRGADQDGGGRLTFTMEGDRANADRP